MRTKKGFTLVELLVVIAIIALLMGILMPALARVRQIAYRLICGTNLSGLGKACLVYANDNMEEYPRAGGRDSTWSVQGSLVGFGFAADTEQEAFPTGQATIGSDWFLLIRYADVTPNQYVCKGDVGCRPFKLSDWDTGSAGGPLQDITKAWDFGRKPSDYCTYAYHNPHTAVQNAQSPNKSQDFPLTPNLFPGTPIAADRNPYLDTNATHLEATTSLPTAVSGEKPACDEWVPGTGGGYKDEDGTDNSMCHQRDGQNVLYNDGSVHFEKFPNVGENKDNIYQYWPTNVEPTSRKIQESNGGKPFRGAGAGASTGGSTGLVYPSSPADACLVNEPQNAGFRPRPNTQQ
jgi:prepilin-type N-terminal cleavage/methylation domain-containing protein